MVKDEQCSVSSLVAPSAPLLPKKIYTLPIKNRSAPGSGKIYINFQVNVFDFLCSLDESTDLVLDNLSSKIKRQDSHCYLYNKWFKYTPMDPQPPPPPGGNLGLQPFPPSGYPTLSKTLNPHRKNKANIVYNLCDHFTHFTLRLFDQPLIPASRYF